jgi:hypothetical protein
VFTFSACGAGGRIKEYVASIHRAREAGGSFLLFAISSLLRLGQWLSPAFAGLCDKSLSYLGFRATALHPRLYSAARIRGLRTRQNPGNDKFVKLAIAHSKRNKKAHDRS